MGRESILKLKSFNFAVRVIKLYNYLKKKHRDYEFSLQLLRSGTSIGALIREAEHAESKKDFIHKLQISLKEANECIYWLQLLYATEYINKRMFESLFKDVEELLKILIASIKTLKRQINASPN